ncbi:HEPN domain-containing protein [Streptomyces sp. NPDC006251]|uniref:ApeA N-terminal domain 1-containing protein n=1 Tax=Streptomyces sp. NPDC006251 TaxID=3155718 RepID=UPI0033AD365E
MEPFEGHGHWWLLGNEENKVPGTLKIDSSGGAELYLIGSLRSFEDFGESTTANGVTTTSFTQESMERSGTYPRIHGLIGTIAYTLEDCFQKRSARNLMGGIPTEVVHVNQVFKNVYYEEDEETVASGISFVPRHLSYWVRKGGLASSIRAPHERQEQESEAEPHISVHGYEVPSDDVTLTDGAELHLRQRLTLSGDGITSKEIKQLYYYRYDAPGLRHMNDLLEVASDLQDLVSVATNRTAQFDEVAFYHPEIKLIPEKEDSALKPIEFIARWNAAVNTPEKVPNSLVFGYEEFGGMNGVASWLAVAAKHRISLGRVMATRYSKSMPVSDRLLNRAASLESFDRVRNGDSIDFGARMARCANYAGGEFMEMVKNRRKWSKMVKEDRDDIAHNLGRSRETAEQIFLADSLYWLFILCLLKEAKAPREVFRSIKKYGEYSWLCTKVSTLVRAA